MTFIFLVSSLCHFSQAQLTEYKPLASTGEMPLSFRTMTYDKVKQDLDKIQLEENEKRQVKKTKQEFLLKSNYQIDRILLSGKVLYNDPVGQYVNDVANKIYEVEPELKDKVEIYVVKSSRVNAFTTQRGTILVTLGLLAQLENESQLAFVLCHEMVHFKRNHVMKKHMHDFQLQRGRGNSYHEKLLSQSTYSREHEFQADEQGFELYKQLGYSVAEVEGIFSVLQYGYLPFDEVEFNKSWLETESLKFPAKYHLGTVNPISIDENYDDIRSSHPNIKRRREAMMKLIDPSEKALGVKFLVSEDRFSNIRQRARYELSKLYMANLEFENSLYNTYLLQTENPDDLYLKKLQVKSLYMYSRLKTNSIDPHSRTKPEITDYEDVEGESQRLSFLLQKMSPVELSITCVAKSWEIYLETKDPVMKDYAYSALKSLIYEHDKERSDFFRVSRDQLASKADTKVSNDDSKYQKIEKKTFKERLSRSSPFDFAFVNLFKNPEFNQAYTQMVDEKHASYYAQDKTISKASSPRGDVSKQKIYDPINKVVMVNPFYTSYSNPREPGMELVRAEMRKNKVMDLYKHNAKRLDMDMTMITPQQMNANSTQNFNEMSALNDWIVEWTLMNGLDDYINSNTEYISNLPDKYGSDYFLWSGFESATHKKVGKGSHIALSLLFPPLLPVAIYSAARPGYHTNIYFVLFNVKENKAEMIEAYQLTGKDRLSRLNLHIYKFLKKVNS